MGHRLEQGAAQVVGVGQGLGLAGFDSQPAVLEDGGELGGEGVEDELVLGRDARAREGEEDAVVELLGRSASSGRSGTGSPARPRRPSPRGPAQHGGGVEAERSRRLSSRAGSGSSSPMVAARRARVRAWSRPGPPRRAPAARSTKPLTTRATPRNTARATTFSPSAIVHSWNGRGEVPVGEQERRHRGDQGRAVPPTAATITTSARYISSTVGGRPSPRNLDEATVSSGSPRGESPRRSSAVGVERRPVGGAGRRRSPSAVVPSRLVGDDVDVDGPGEPDGPVDDRAADQLPPTGAAAGAEDELGGVLGAGEVHEGGGDVGAGDLVVLAADVLEQAAVLVEEGAAGRRGPRRRGRGRPAARPGPAGRCGRPAGSGLAGRGAGEGDDDPLAGLPGLGDPVALRYSSRPTSTWSATQSRASSRRAPRLPARK